MSDQGVHRSAAAPQALVREAWGNLLALRQRSALALLGIVIGTASVVAMLSIGQMAGKEALKPFVSMGVDLLAVQSTNGAGELRPLTLSAVELLPRRVPEVVAATAFAVGRETIITNPNLPPPTIVAARPALAQLAGLRVERGRLLVDADAQSLVAVIGADIASPATPATRPVSIGDRVKAGAYLYRVVGVLQSTPQNALSPADFNRTILIPLGSASRSLDNVEPTGALVKMASEADEKQVAAAVTDALRPTTSGAQLEIRNARDMVAAMKAQKAVTTRLLAALGGISLIVGGLGVMNVMLMGMMERRREIGLRVALGATPWDIQLMFLTEAAVLAAVGGLLGASLGVVAAFAAAALSHWPFSVALYALPLGAGIAMVVGLLFGLYPAIKAAQLDPIEALRAD